jgi:protein-S-isoprenylcysteine O-methyltransferase Ste14
MTESTYEEAGASVRFPPPLVFLFCTLAGVALHYLVLPAPVPLVRVLSTVVGITIGLIAFAIVIPARVLFSRTGQNPIPWKPTPELIFRGPYRITRNPMYVGMTTFQVGLGVAVNNLWIVALALPALMIVHFIAVLPEERYLIEKFGEPYQAYLARVRRYL